MKTAVIAVDPETIRQTTFKTFAELIGARMSEGLFDQTIVVSVMHRHLYPGPIKWYSEAKEKLRDELFEELQDATRTHLGEQRVEVLQAKSPRHDSIAETLDEFVKDVRADIVVLLDKKHGILYESVLGSVASKMLEITEVPVLLINSESGEVSLKQPKQEKSPQRIQLTELFQS